MKVETHKIKTWIDWQDLEDGAIEQINNLTKLPFMFQHVAIMPDCHQGYGMPIGGVLATKGVVVPNAVGVDIGCGVMAQKTNLTSIAPEGLKQILGRIRQEIPVGMKHHLVPNTKDMPMLGIAGWPMKVVVEEQENAAYQLGTLGGGNHFIEIQKGSDGFIWVMIHSGSRNLGYRVAKHYNDLARELNKRWLSIVDDKWELAFLPLDTEEGQHYLNEMNYCQKFAGHNRNCMMDQVMGILQVWAEDLGRYAGKDFVFKPGDRFDIAHNYAAFEHHYGQNVMVHRKGATRVQEGEIGLVPGSMGTSSYMVRGKGCCESFDSCSHGAGRRMSRTAARKELNLQEEIKKMDDLGIVHGVRTEADLDEAAGAYKDIKQVMENQNDLVDILIEFKPLAVVKG